MKLSLYVARRFLRMFLAVLAIFFGILMMVGTVDQIRDLGGKAGIGAALHLALLNAPASLYRILPLITVLATISLFLALARSSELVVIRAAGRSGLRTLMAPVFTAFLLGVLAVAAFNPIVAATQKQAEVQSDRYNGNDRSRLSVSGEGLWLRQGGPEGQSVIRAARANNDGTRLEDATFLSFGQSGPTKRIAAAKAELRDGMWHLSDVKEWTFEDPDDNPEANPEATAQRHDTLEIPSDLTAARIRDGFGTPSEISIWNLPAFISGLEDAGFSARRHLVWFQMELALPLLLAAMVLVGAGFTMRHARFGKTGLMVLFAMAAGFAIFFLRNFAQVLGENGQIPVALAAWAPPAAGILFSLGLLLHLEDG